MDKLKKYNKIYKIRIVIGYATPAKSEEISDLCKIRVNVTDHKGDLLNLSEASCLVKAGTSVIWGKAGLMGGYGVVSVQGICCMKQN